jgi:hypothetical protein
VFLGCGNVRGIQYWEMQRLIFKHPKVWVCPRPLSHAAGERMGAHNLLSQWTDEVGQLPAPGFLHVTEPDPRERRGKHRLDLLGLLPAALEQNNCPWF